MQEIEKYPERRMDLENKIRLLEKEIEGNNPNRF